jgi:hypothetical protein
MDKHSELVTESTFAAAILGNAASLDYVFVCFDALPVNLDAIAAQRGLSFVGTIGIVQGVARTALAVPLSPGVMASLSEAFLILLERRFDATLKPKGDFEKFAESLFALEDERTA